MRRLIGRSISTDDVGCSKRYHSLNKRWIVGSTEKVPWLNVSGNQLSENQNRRESYVDGENFTVYASAVERRVTGSVGWVAGKFEGNDRISLDGTEREREIQRLRE